MVNAALEGADTFVEIERWVKEKRDWLHKPEQWPDPNSSAVIESPRTVKGKAAIEPRFYISSLPAEAARLGQAIRSRWSVESRLHQCMPLPTTRYVRAAGTPPTIWPSSKRITLNLIRLDPAPRKGGIKASRLITAPSDRYRSQ